jgi:Rrf2 family iron-sulfur cluster assembly transcriptional regulator
MAMADLAGRGAGGPATLSAIAGRQEISLAYLEQLFGKLRRAGLVAAARGPGGGYRLAKPAGQLRIADIVMAVDEPIKATRCPGESEQGCLGRKGRCLTHDLWDELGTQIHLFLNSVTLADVLEHRVKGRARPAAPPRATQLEMAE